MMKQLSLLMLLCVLTLGLTAQSHTGTTTFDKTPQSSVIFNLPYSEDAVSNGLEKRMKPYGKSKKVKGFIMYKDIRINQVSKEPLTYYFNVDKKSNKDNENSVLTMMIADANDHFYSVEENRDIFNNAKEFLNEFEASSAAAGLELLIVDQDELVKKTEKKLKGLRDDGLDYEKDKKKLEERIADNNKQVEAMEQELAKQKEKIDALMKQRKN